jgi:hypothetical protein
MAALPVEILLGLYLGVLTGIIPGLVAWALGFLFKHTTGVSIPGFGVVVLALALAGVNGGLLALADRSVITPEGGIRVLVAIIVVLMIALYAHAKGDQMGASFPKRVSLSSLRERTLPSDVVELLGGRGGVRIEVAGEVADMEGYPPLPADVRRAIRDGEWRFPADLSIAQLEARLGERLRTEFDLVDVSVDLDARGRATVSAAPPLSGLSKHVPPGRRAVSVDALVPTGLARGDEVAVLTDGGRVEGTVVSARSDLSAPDAEPATGADEASPDPTGGTDADRATDGGTDPPGAPTTAGGDGRVTLAVPRSDADRLLGVDRSTILVKARGIRREFELVSLLRRGGTRFRKFTLRAGGPLDGTTIGDANVRDAHGVAILAVRRPDGWAIAPDGDVSLAGDDTVFAVGTRDALDRFGEAVA